MAQVVHIDVMINVFISFSAVQIYDVSYFNIYQVIASVFSLCFK